MSSLPPSSWVVREGEPDRDALGDLLVRSDESTIFHEPGWLDALHTAYPENQPRWLWIEGHDGRLEAALPFCRALTRWRREIASLPFGTYGGPIARPDAAAGVHEALLARFRSLCAGGSVRGALIQVDPSPYQQAALRAVYGNRMLEDSTAVFRLVPDFRSEYDTRTRRNLRLADKHDITVTSGNTPGDLDTLHSLMSHQAPGWTGTWFHSRDQLRSMLGGLGDRAVVWTAHHQGRAVCAQLVLQRPGRDGHLWMSGALPESRELRALYVVIDRILESAVAAGYRTLDLGGSLGDRGIARFKRNLGFAPTPLWTVIEQPWWFDWVQALRWNRWVVGLRRKRDR